jgi:hypothetical protein
MQIENGREGACPLGLVELRISMRLAALRRSPDLADDKIDRASGS